MSDLLGAADSATAANISRALDFLVSQKLAQLSTATLVQIQAPGPYDTSGNPIAPGTPGPIGFVDVLPLVNQVDGYGNATPHDKVYKLSYYRNESANGSFINDPVVGDIGKMIVADRDTSVVRATNAQANPGSRRKFDKADGTFFGCTQSAGAPTQWFAWLTKGFNLTDAYGNTIIGGLSGVEINGVLITRGGDVISKKGIDLDHHVHGGVQSGTSNTGQPV